MCADALDLDAARLRVIRTVIDVSGHTSFKPFPMTTAERRTVPLPGLGLVEADGEKFRAEWIDGAGVPASAMFGREPAGESIPGNDEGPLFLLVRGPSEVVGDTRIELVTSSVSRKRSPTELIARGGGGNRTRVQGFAGPCLSHSATPPTLEPKSSERSVEFVPWRSDGTRGSSERTTGFEPATLTLAR